MKYRVIVIDPFNQNCLLIWCARTKEAMIVDPGGEVEKIRKVVDQFKVNVKKILLTHGHVDHVGGATNLKQYYRVPILGPDQKDKWLLKNLHLQYKILGWDTCVIDNILVPDVWLKEGNVIAVGYENFSVLHCPGHSPGHIVFLNEMRKFIIMGDVLFKNGIGRTDLPGGDFVTLMHSIKNKLFTLDDRTVFCPGHGKPSILGYERTQNPFFSTKKFSNF